MDCGAVRANKTRDHRCKLPKGHGGPHKAEYFIWGDPQVPYGMKKPLEIPRSGDRTKFGFWTERGIGFRKGQDFERSLEAYDRLEKK